MDVGVQVGLCHVSQFNLKITIMAMITTSKEQVKCDDVPRPVKLGIRTAIMHV